MDSLDGLDRLLEVEKRASELLSEAEAEAGELVGRARDEVKKDEHKALAEAKLRLDQEAAGREAEAEAALAAELSAYKAALETLPRDRAAFEAACAAVLFPRG